MPRGLLCVAVGWVVTAPVFRDGAGARVYEGVEMGLHVLQGVTGHHTDQGAEHTGDTRSHSRQKMRMRTLTELRELHGVVSFYVCVGLPFPHPRPRLWVPGLGHRPGPASWPGGATMVPATQQEPRAVGAAQWAGGGRC